MTEVDGDNDQQRWNTTPLTWTDAAIAVTLALLALLARWPFIERGETLLHSDEAMVGIMAQDIAAGRKYPIYFYGQRYMGAMESYTIAFLLRYFENPIHALRLAPALYFTLMVAAQYLMLTRWYGRAGGVMGALTLIAAPPLFMHWSIAARGGYIEVLLVGTLVLWAYGEWFVARERPSPVHLALFGALLGFGRWLNQTILVFAAPVVLHALMQGPIARRREQWLSARKPLDRLGNRWFGSWPLQLPLLGLLLIFAVTACWSVTKRDDVFVHLPLYGFLPTPVGGVIVLLLLLAIALVLRSRTTFFTWARAGLEPSAPFLFGFLLGSGFELLYMAQHLWSGKPLEDMLPLGPRAPWTIGEPLDYFWRALLLFTTPDGTPIIHLNLLGREHTTLPLAPWMATVLFIAQWLLLPALLVLAIRFYKHRGQEIATLFRLTPTCYSPSALLLTGLCSLFALYIFGGMTVSFTTNRYLVPMWAFLPGLLTAAVISPRATSSGTTEPADVGRVENTIDGRALIAIAACWMIWSFGQYSFSTRLGRPHDLHRVADALVQRAPGPVLAELFDAHLLNYLTKQQVRLGEFHAFWPRLLHLRADLPADGPVTYLVETVDRDWTLQWRDTGWPGDAPPETQRILYPKLKKLQREQPQKVLRREPLTEGFELWTIQKPLREPDISTGKKTSNQK